MEGCHICRDCRLIFFHFVEPCIFVRFGDSIFGGLVSFFITLVADVGEA